MASQGGYHHSQETKQKLRSLKLGNKNPNYGNHNPWTEKRRKAHKPRNYIKNGKEYLPNWRELRKIIYKRDEWICQECKIHCHGNGTKDKIQCHHVDYNTMNNEYKNLITLCASCHAKTNFSKEDWIKYFILKIGG